jgi:integrase
MGSPVPAPAGPRRQAVAATAVRGLSRFAAARGIPPGREFVLDYDVIEAFCVSGLPGCASSTRGTYRSALYRQAVPVHGEPGQRATPFAGARAPALAVVVFGIGAGLRPGELTALRGSDVIRHGRRVAVHVSGPAARVVPVTPAYAGRAAGLAAAAGHAHLFRPGPADRGYKNFVTNFARTLAADPAAPRLRLGRCRSSFICGHLAAGTPLGELLAITGICQAESLARYARHVGSAPSKAVLRAWDRRRQGC